MALQLTLPSPRTLRCDIKVALHALSFLLFFSSSQLSPASLSLSLLSSLWVSAHVLESILLEPIMAAIEVEARMNLRRLKCATSL